MVTIEFNINQLKFKTRFLFDEVNQFTRLMSDIKTLENFIPRKRVDVALKTMNINDLEIIHNDLIIDKLKWLSNLEPIFIICKGYKSIYRNVGWSDDPDFKLVQICENKSDDEINSLISKWDTIPTEPSVANVENFTYSHTQFIPGSSIAVKNFTISEYPGKTRIQFVNVDYNDDELKY